MPSNRRWDEARIRKSSLHASSNFRLSRNSCCSSTRKFFSSFTCSKDLEKRKKKSSLRRKKSWIYLALTVKKKLKKKTRLKKKFKWLHEKESPRKNRGGKKNVLPTQAWAEVLCLKRRLCQGVEKRLELNGGKKLR